MQIAVNTLMLQNPTKKNTSTPNCYDCYLLGMVAAQSPITKNIHHINIKKSFKNYGFLHL